MSVVQGIQNIVRSTGIAGSAESASGQSRYVSISPQAHADFLRARTELLNLYRDIERLAELTNINTRFKLDLPDARSASSLGLDMTHTAAMLSSFEEINASPTSFTPFGPDWDGDSTALITISREYDGSNGSGLVTFEVRKEGVHGDKDLQIRVTGPDGEKIRDLNIRKNHNEDRQYNLRNGLRLQLGPGELFKDDIATIEVSDTIGAVVNPDLPLDGLRNENPNLQWGTRSIRNRSFTINGETIDVSESDTINDVLRRINESDAGVTAAFNALTERVDFIQNTPGSASTIDLQNDRSRFLEATKLDSAGVVDGIDPETIKTLDEVSEFSTVQSGNIVINGREVAVDTANDSLATMLQKINDSGAGVVASFDSASQLVVIEAEDSASALEIDGNSTGFFAALKIPEGRVDPEAVARGISRRRSYAIADATDAVFDRLNRLFQDSTFVGNGENAALFREPLDAALRAIFGGDSADILGLGFDSSANARQRGSFTSIDRSELTTNLQRRGNLMRDLFAGLNGEDGLVKGLLTASRQALNSVNQSLGLSGTFVDTYA